MSGRLLGRYSDRHAKVDAGRVNAGQRGRHLTRQHISPDYEY